MDEERPKHRAKRQPVIADAAALRTLALGYVARFATTRAKLEAYLKRKLKDAEHTDLMPHVPEIAASMVDLGYVDDAAFARSRSASLARRGYGPARVRMALRVAGIDKGIADERADDVDSLAAALAFARKRRLGPFAKAALSPDQERRALAAMIRAGHEYGIARTVLGMRDCDASSIED